MRQNLNTQANASCDPGPQGLGAKVQPPAAQAEGPLGTVADHLAAMTAAIKAGSKDIEWLPDVLQKKSGGLFQESASSVPHTCHARLALRHLDQFEAIGKVFRNPGGALKAVRDLHLTVVRHHEAAAEIEAHAAHLAARNLPGPTPEWGIHVDGSGPKWGARAIFNREGRKHGHPLDLLFDRQYMTQEGPDAPRKALAWWLDEVGLPAMNKILTTHSNWEDYAYRSGGFHLAAWKPHYDQYVHLGAAADNGPTAEELAAAQWSGEDPIPAVGDRVRVTIGRFGDGDVVGHFIEHGYAGVRVLLDQVPPMKQKYDPDWKAQWAETGSIQVVSVFGCDLARCKIDTNRP